MNDERFTRLESRVDEIKDNVSDLKAEHKILSNSFDLLNRNVSEYTELVKNHVTGDNKIIKEIIPVIENFQYEQETKRRRVAFLKYWGLKLAIPATIVGIVAGVARIISTF
jgi:hypothetical protein